GNVFIGYDAGSSETGSNTLYIDNSDTSAPLIKGDFNANALKVNGTLAVTRQDGLTPSGRVLDANAELTVDEIYHSNGTKMLSYSGGSVHLGPTSMIFTDSSVSTSGADVMTSTVGRIQIGNGASDTTNVVGALSVNGTSVMGSISGLADGVRATTALNAAFSAVPTMSGDRQFECGTGVGRYDTKIAIATSCGARLSDQITSNIGISVLPSGSESYSLGTLPSYALRAGISFKFGKSYDSSKRKWAAVENASWNSYQTEQEVAALRKEVSEMKAMMADLLSNRVVPKPLN
ncbi:MAG: YadA-like family protein, partial [Pirellulales bacterium]